MEAVLSILEALGFTATTISLLMLYRLMKIFQQYPEKEDGQRDEDAKKKIRLPFTIMCVNAAVAAIISILSFVLQRLT